ncbi:hypothetical protein L4D08_26330, partial [Photobacterium chitinilyticum]|uniref:hypothetical protein n=1 Tax=Photobacterium chitinilyticum TaxID=2485123 RepID=UPI003D0C7A7C
MIKSEILFDPIINEISEITQNTQKSEQFWNSLSDEERHKFDEISDALAAEYDVLSTCKDELEKYNDLVELHNIFERFNNDFSHYPGFGINKINFILLVIGKINQYEVDLDELEFQNSFGVFYRELNFEGEAFYSNVEELHNNVAYFSPSSKASIEKLVEHDSSVDFWYSLLSMTGEINFDFPHEAIVCRQNVIADNHKNIITLLKIHLASSGKVITQSNIYSEPPVNGSLLKLAPNKDYSQFEEVVHIFGEYN